MGVKENFSENHALDRVDMVARGLIVIWWSMWEVYRSIGCVLGVNLVRRYYT